jgi:alcohol dehydrogenase
MRAYVYKGPNEMRFEEVKEPKILDPSDAIVKVSYSALCGMDIKIRKGLLPEVCPERVLGHEFCGIIEETGSAVKGLKKGDRVAVNSVISCGVCESCLKCENEKCMDGGWLIGYLIDGCQAELTRVPFADYSLTKIPDDMDLKDAVFAGDVALSGYQAAINANIGKGDTVAVLGSGPAASVAMMVARIFHPDSVIAIDIKNDRLNKIEKNKIADKIISIDGVNIVSEIREKMNNKANIVIEATGKNIFFETALDISDKFGTVSVLSVYPEPLIFCTDKIAEKKVTLKTGRVEKNAVENVLELIRAGYIDSDFLCSRSGSFGDIAEGYKVVENKDNGFFKWVCCHSKGENL